MNIAAIIIGIDGWERYTKPLIESIQKYEPECWIAVIDNDSKERLYPQFDFDDSNCRAMTFRTDRLCYSAAINYGAAMIHDADWYIVLSNDVLCTGPFAHILAEHSPNDVVGPALKETHGFHYIEGWCVAIPRQIWDTVGGWDERFLGSDWEDVAFSTRARQRGFGLVEDLPFVHLDQRQRYNIIEDFWGKDAHNRELFMREYARGMN